MRQWVSIPFPSCNHDIIFISIGIIFFSFLIKGFQHKTVPHIRCYNPCVNRSIPSQRNYRCLNYNSEPINLWNHTKQKCIKNINKQNTVWIPCKFNPNKHQHEFTLNWEPLKRQTHDKQTQERHATHPPPPSSLPVGLASIIILS